MGKLHTLRRAILRDPELWVRRNYSGHVYRIQGARRYRGEWCPAWGLSYCAFVRHVLREHVGVAIGDGGRGGQAGRPPVDLPGQRADGLARNGGSSPPSDSPPPFGPAPTTAQVNEALRDMLRGLRYLVENPGAVTDQVRICARLPVGLLSDMRAWGYVQRTDLDGGGAVWCITGAGREALEMSGG